jgi:hypothetical protein
MTERSILYPVALAALLAGCSSTTPHYDARVGEGVRNARLQLTSDPQAGKTAGVGVDGATGMDGRATRHSMERYEQSYKSPPQAVNVINIGGSLTSNNSGSSGSTP